MCRKRKTCPGAKITSIATINYINQLLFHRPSSVIFQWTYEPQLQRLSRSALEITELLWYQFRYRSVTGTAISRRVWGPKFQLNTTILCLQPGNVYRTETRSFLPVAWFLSDWCFPFPLFRSGGLEIQFPWPLLILSFRS